MRERTKGMLFGVLLSFLVAGTAISVLAASGSVAFNTSNIQVNENRLANIGEGYLLENGCEVPYSITYTNEKGGGTTYLSIRKISQLFNTKIGWDASTQSVLIANDNSSTYTYTDKYGRYVFGAMDGAPTGTVDVTTKSGVLYHGDYSKTKITGSGKMTYPGIGTYTGEFLNGDKQGTGTFQWNDGARYVGKWEMDKMNGQGTYYYDSGSTHRLVGSFKNNIPEGKMEYYNSDGKMFSTVWENGSCVKIN